MSTVQDTAIAHAYPPNNHPESEVILATSFASKDRWADHLRAAGLRVRVAPDDTGPSADVSAVEFAICWQPEPGLLQRCPNLKAIQSMGAGVDSLLREATLPRSVPLLRVIDPLMAQRMATWVLWGVINVQRRCDEYWHAQLKKNWDKGIENLRNVDNSELRVGVMGMGVMGSAVTDLLVQLGYCVSAWTRRPKQRKGVTCFSGTEQLNEFASQQDIVVCLLPLTAATEGILDDKLFSAMPKGAAVINAARGAHCVESDLLTSLDSGQLSHAILDVFSPEPLPQESRLWSHPQVRIFPHVSSMTNIETAVEQMLANRDAVLENGPLPPELVVDWEAGY